MANPFVFHENIFENNTPTATSAVAGFPITNITDWRLGTAYRWKATSTATQNIDIDAGSTQSLNTLVIGGHNLGTGTASVELLKGAASPAATNVTGPTAITSDLPWIITFNEGVARQHWRIQITSAGVAAQTGIITLGRRIDYSAGALLDLDPYHRASSVEPFINNNGSPIGVNVRSKTKRFVMSYGGGDPGMTEAAFFAPSSGLKFRDDFLPHAVDSAKPFWFAWNIDVDAQDVYLCRVDGPEVSMPFVGSTLSSGLQTTFIAHRETS